MTIQLASPQRPRVLDALRVFFGAFRGALAAVLRRMIGRARNPRWSFAFEVAIDAIRGAAWPIPTIGLVRWRSVIESISPVLTDGLPPRLVDVRPQGLPLQAAWLEPPDAGPTVLLYLHGGGYVFGSLRTHGSLVVAIARASGARALALEYRLAPEHPAPAALEDAVLAYRHLLAEGIAPARIVVAGDSAGGGLALATLVALRERGLPMPAGAVALSPWVDLACSGESFSTNAPYDFLSRDLSRVAADHFRGSYDPDAPEVSPRYADLRGLPPLLVQAGQREVLVDQIRAFVDRAREAQVDVTYDEYPEMVHVWHIHRAVEPEARRAVDQLGRFVRARTADGSGLSRD